MNPSPDSRPPARASLAVLLEGLLVGSALFLSAFVGAHEVMLAAVWGGPGTMDRFARSLEETGFVGPGVVVVFAVLAVHVLAALRHAPVRLGEIVGYAKTTGRLLHWDTLTWGIQIATALAVGWLATEHILVQGRDLPIAAGKSAARVLRLAPRGFYDVLLFATALHTCLGLERIATKWLPVGRGAARAAAWLAFFLILAAGFATLVAFLRLARGA